MHCPWWSVPKQAYVQHCGLSHWWQQGAGSLTGPFPTRHPVWQPWAILRLYSPATCHHQVPLASVVPSSRTAGGHKQQPPVATCFVVYTSPASRARPWKRAGSRQATLKTHAVSPPQERESDVKPHTALPISKAANVGRVCCNTCPRLGLR